MVKYIFISLMACSIMACNNVSGASTKEESHDLDSVQNETTAPAKLSTKDLALLFDRKKSGNEYFIQPKNISANGNGVYLYFREVANKAKGLRLHIQYWGENYPEADLYRFDVDGKTTEYMANRDKQGAGNTRIAQSIVFYWYDNGINQSDQKFLESLAQSAKASISLVDRATNKVVANITLTAKEKQTILQTFDYYFALNGAKIPKKGMVNIRGN